jgi:anthranilate synthase component 1
VAKVGTVRPTEQFIIERYSHVMHIVSNVVGRIAEGEDALSALLAGLPAGTVSGAPKVRAMQIIDELEPVYDSDPDAEYEETVNKSRALRRAAEDAGLFAGRGNG